MYNFIYIILFLSKNAKDFLVKIFNTKNYDNQLMEGYLKKNQNLKKYDLNKKLNKKILITDFVSTVGYTVIMSIIGKYSSIIEKAKLEAIIREGDIRGKKIITSFGVSKFYNIKLNFFFKRLNYFKKAIILANKAKNVEDFLQIKDQNINIGLIVYDHILRHAGIEYTRKINFKFVYFLSIALDYNNFCKQFFKKNKYDYIIQSETQFIPSAIFFENALLFKNKVLAHEGGTKEVSVRIYKNLDQRFEGRSLFSNKLYKLVEKQSSKKIEKVATTILKKRFKGKSGSQDLRGALVAYKLKKKFNKKSLCIKYNWDYNKPIIAIFASDFYDGTFGVPWKAFRDNFEWFNTTIELIQKLDNINWLIKKHPIENPKKEHTEIFKYINNISKQRKNIQIFDDDLNSGSLINVIDALITQSGSAGLEYPCFNIPSIISSKSYYGGFGFTNEAKSIKAYKSLLKKINKFGPKKLSINRSKALTYFYLCFYLSKTPIPLVPPFDLTRNLDEDQFWKKMKKLTYKYKVKNDYFLYCLRKQLSNSFRHTINYKKLKN